MSTLERSTLAEKIDKTNQLIRELIDRDKPINSVAEFRKVAGITSNDDPMWQQARAAKLATVSLEELADVSAQERGFRDATDWYMQTSKDNATKDYHKRHPPTANELLGQHGIELDHRRRATYAK